MIDFAAIFIYSHLLQWLGLPLARAVAVVSDSMQRQLEGRVIGTEQLLLLARQRRCFKRCAVFFCSSAGEYEQAKPVIERLSREQVFTHILFFSRSGFDFAKAREEKSSFCLAPMDTIWEWGTLFASLQPDAVFLVRHEFWPGFLWTTQQWSSLSIIDAVPPAMVGREPKWKTLLSALGKRWMLGKTARAYTVDAAGTDYFRNMIGLTPDHVIQIGDTKFDRVVERVEQMRISAESKAQGLRSHWGDPNRPILVLGSAHVPDLELLLPALARPSAPKLRLLVVPHDLSPRNLARINDLLRSASFAVDLMSDVDTLLMDRRSTDCDAIVVDIMGRLSELYAAGDLAWIGGAVHAKVHNVLEPAARGLPMTCGPRFENSQEAKHLVECGLLLPVTTAEEALFAWQKQLQERAVWREQLNAELARLCGASDFLAEEFKSERLIEVSHA